MTIHIPINNGDIVTLTPTPIGPVGITITEEGEFEPLYSAVLSASEVEQLIAALMETRR